MIIIKLRQEQLHTVPNAEELVEEFQLKLDTVIKAEILHLAVYEGNAIGFIATSVKVSGNEVVGYLEAAYVQAEYRGKEVFSKLYQNMVAGLKAFGCTKVQLEVDYDNSEAYDIYQHMGFESKVVLMERNI